MVRGAEALRLLGPMDVGNASSSPVRPAVDGERSCRSQVPRFSPALLHPPLPLSPMPSPHAVEQDGGRGWT